MDDKHTTVMDDQHTTVAELREVLQRFVSERDWSQFHTPKNLSMALAVEVAELMEHFQWRTPDEADNVVKDEKLMDEVEQEIADVACYLLAICNSLGVDLSTAIHRKMVLNRKKYPIETSQGNWQRPNR